MNQDFTATLAAYQARVNQAIDASFPADDSRAAAAARYSLDAGGKRLRPILAVAFYQALVEGGAVAGGSNPGLVYRAALSLEYVHTFSLIHDDLPALDNDDLRRGQPTCHRQFDEATAILAGDYLLNLAYLNLATSALPPSVQAALTHTLASATSSLLAGEMLDLEGEARPLTAGELELMFTGKTAALFRSCFLFGAILAGASLDSTAPHLLTAARQLGHDLGLAFQIQDDVLDVIGDEKALGKKVHKDAAASKNTWVAHYSLPEAQLAYHRYYHQVATLLEEILPLSLARTFLLQLISYLEHRQT